MTSTRTALAISDRTKSRWTRVEGLHEQFLEKVHQLEKKSTRTNLYEVIISNSSFFVGFSSVIPVESGYACETHSAAHSKFVCVTLHTSPS